MNSVGNYVTRQLFEIILKFESIVSNLKVDSAHV